MLKHAGSVQVGEYIRIIINILIKVHGIFCIAIIKSVIEEERCGVTTYKDSFLRIVGGDAVTKGSNPWQASLQSYRGHGCGAVILNRNWLVTAAHCM